MIISKHALCRLKDRFSLSSKNEINDILSILSNPRACINLTNKKGGLHLKFKYRGVYMVAVIKNGVIITFKYRDRVYMENRKEQNMNKKVSAEKVMTVKEVAEVLGVGAEAIKWHVRKHYPDLIQNGKTTYLNEQQVVFIKRKMIPTSQLVGAKTDIEMMNQIAESISWLNTKISTLEQENQLMIPKAAFYDRVTESSKTIDISECAKILHVPNVGRNKMFAILRGMKILKENNLPYQKYCDRGYFKIVEAETAIGIVLKTVVYQKGLDYIRKVVSK